MKRVSNTLFVLVLFAFSASLAVLSLFASIKLAALNDTAAKLTKSINQLTEENAILLAATEKTVSMEELERYALDRLGMCRCTPEQIEILNINDYIA